MAQSREDIIEQLREAVKMQNALIKSQNKVISYWQDQAIAYLEREVEGTQWDGLLDEWMVAE